MSKRGKKAERTKRIPRAKSPRVDVPRTSVLKQVGILIGVSVVLGFLFNSINPSGIEKEEGSTGKGVPDSTLHLAGEEGALPLSAVPAYDHQGHSNADGFPIVTWDQVQDLSANFGALIVDARPQWAFDAGNLPQSVCLPSSVEMTPAYHEFAAKYPKNRHIVIYCSDLACGRSRDLAVQLRKEFGFTSLFLYEGGYKDYLALQQ